MKRLKRILIVFACINFIITLTQLSKKEVRKYVKFIGWHRPHIWLHGIFYFSKTLWYVRLGRFANKFAGLIPGFMKKKYADTYHGKIVPVEFAQKLVTVEEEIEIRGLEKIIPYEACMDIVIENPDAILACKCVCRVSSDKHCMPDEVCLLVGEPFVSLVLRQQPEFCRRITQQEAAEILRITDEQGCVHAAFFKDVAKGRFYAICNCCKCCCVGIESYRFSNVPFYGHSGMIPAISEECVLCGSCVQICPFEALSIGSGSVPSIDLSACMGCAACASVCGSGAVSMIEAPDRPDVLDLNRLR